MTTELDPARIGPNIAHARKRIGITQDEVAKAIGVSRPLYISMESGQRAPTELQIYAIAQKFGASVRELLNLEAPDSTTSVRFRGLRANEDAASAVDSLEDFGRRYVALERDAAVRTVRREPSVFSIDGARNLERAADELASLERHRLGLGDGPLPSLRAILEEYAGLRVFGLRNLKKTRISGLFAYSAEYGPLIGYNAAHDARRVRWTLCHEYAHFLTERYEPEVTVVDAGGRPSRRETFADAFAARFLMPATALSRRFSEMLDDASGEMKVAHLVMLAHFFDVSFQAITQRLEELDRITRGTYEMLKKRGFRPRDAEKQLGIEVEPPIERLPFRYVYLVSTAYVRGEISEGDVADYLDTDRLDARQTVQTTLESDGGTGEASTPGLDSPIGARH